MDGRSGSSHNVLPCFLDDVSRIKVVLSSREVRIGLDSNSLCIPNGQNFFWCMRSKFGTVFV